MNNKVGDRRGEGMKVFGVGFQRTGTTSLSVALNTLGIKTLQFPKELYNDIDHDVIREFDGFTDDPVTLLYQELIKNIQRISLSTPSGRKSLGSKVFIGF